MTYKFEFKFKKLILQIDTCFTFGSGSNTCCYLFCSTFRVQNRFKQIAFLISYVYTVIIFLSAYFNTAWYQIMFRIVLPEKDKQYSRYMRRKISCINTNQNASSWGCFLSKSFCFHRNFNQTKHAIFWFMDLNSSQLYKDSNYHGMLNLQQLCSPRLWLTYVLDTKTRKCLQIINFSYYPK